MGAYKEMMIDPNEITPEEDLVTPERLAKGDLEVARNLKGKVSRAIPAHLTIIKELIRRDVAPFHYEVYGVAFLELRAAFRSPWAARSAAVLLEQWGIGVSYGQANSVYQNVCKRLEPWRIRVIEHVLEDVKELEKKGYLPTYRDCFDLLVTAMDEERARMIEENSF